MALGKVYVAKAIYDFAVDGGAVGEIELAQTEIIPEGATVIRVTTNETTALTGSDDIDIQIGSVKINTAVDYTGDTGVKSRTCVPVEISTAAAIKLDNDAVGTIDSGVVEIYVEYFL